MKLKYVKGQNFLSIGNSALEVNLDNHEKTLVVGENGSGKSVLIEMLTFLLYGKPYRKLLKGEMVNTENGKKCVVEGEFEARNHTWKIVRGIKPDVLEVYKDGEKVESTAAKDDFQTYIETYAIPFNYKSFKQVIALGTAGYKQFMDLTTPERREFVEEILDIGVFSIMNKLNKDYIKTAKLKLKDNRDGREVVEHKMTTLKTVLDKSKNDNKQIINDLNSELREYQIALADAEVKEDKLHESLEAKRSEFDRDVLERTNQAISKIHTMIGQFESEQSGAKKKISFFDQNAECPTCDQKIDDEYKHVCLDVLNKTVLESSDKVARLKEKLDAANQKIDRIQQIRDAVQSISNEYNNVRSDVRNLKSHIENIDNRLRKAQETSSSDVDGIIEELRELNVKRKEFKEKEAKLSQEIHDREMLLSMLKDDGLKATIVGNYLPIINSKVNEYLQTMDVNYGFMLDATFKEKMLARRQSKLSFNSLSQGQRMRVDLALMFTWRDVVQMRSGSKINTLILDEVMDSATDEKGIKALRKIIDSLEDTNTTIISHNEKHDKDWFNRVINVSLSGMFTKYNETIHNVTEFSPYE